MSFSNTVCPLCQSNSSPFHQNTHFYHQCIACCAVFMDAASRLNKQQEKARYLEHNNDVDDSGYQQFVSPITATVLQNHTSAKQGLDFGAGTGPVITKVLTDNGFKLESYDPFFHNEKALLQQQYDYIVCCEVMEHFYHPDKEFALLKRLLKPNGWLYCMTDLYCEAIDFANWYYQKDSTHVFFYHQKSLDFIKEKYAFSDLTVNGRLITFHN